MRWRSDPRQRCTNGAGNCASHLTSGACSLHQLERSKNAQNEALLHQDIAPHRWTTRRPTNIGVPDRVVLLELRFGRVDLVIGVWYVNRSHAGRATPVPSEISINRPAKGCRSN